jgi:hypothetical protein
MPPFGDQLHNFEQFSKIGGQGEAALTWVRGESSLRRR